MRLLLSAELSNGLELWPTSVIDATDQGCLFGSKCAAKWEFLLSRNVYLAAHFNPNWQPWGGRKRKRLYAYEEELPLLPPV
jgi:hypothetical protein